MLPRKLRPWLVLLALGILPQAGCVPTVWLPDSSGFIYIKVSKVGESTALAHFDVKTKKERIIVADIGVSTLWPAVSPDGKRIAVGRLRGGRKEPITLQIIVYNMEGKELQKSKPHAWAPPPTPNQRMMDPVMLFWSPKDDMVLVSDPEQTGVYNVKTDSLKVIENSRVLIHNGTPIRPDGKGFLLLLGKNPDHRLVFMDWTDKEQRIEKEAFVALWPKDFHMRETPLYAPTWWDGDKAFAGFKNAKATYVIDTGKNKIEFTDTFAAMAKKKENSTLPILFSPARFDFPGEVSVQVGRSEAAPGGYMSKVTVINNKTKKEDVILEQGPETSLFIPSPNGNYLALSLSSFDYGLNQKEDIILVINSKGEVVSKLSPMAKESGLAEIPVATPQPLPLASTIFPWWFWVVAGGPAVFCVTAAVVFILLWSHKPSHRRAEKRST
jgi:hypothetical protein